MARTRVGGTYIRSGSIPTTALSGGVVSSSLQVVGALPAGTVSSSAQYPGWVTSSAQVQLGSLSGVTFSNAAFQFPNNVSVEGTLTARELHTKYVSASIIYESGSSKFGDTSDDVMSVTGSIGIVGTFTTTGVTTLGSTLAVSGVTTFSGNVLTGTGTAAVLFRTNGGALSGPALAFVGDDDTGLWRSAAGTLQLVSDGVATLTLTSTAATFSGTLTVTGTTTLSSTLFVGGTAISRYSSAAADAVLEVNNTSTASSANGAVVIMRANGENNTGDVWTRFVSKDSGASETNWSLGIDTSASQAFVLTEGSTLGTQYMRISKTTRAVYFDGATTLGSTLAVSGAVTATGGSVQVSGGSNPFLSLHDGTGYAYVEVVSGVLRLTPRSGQSILFNATTSVGSNFAVSGTTALSNTLSVTSTSFDGVTITRSDAGASSALRLQEGDGGYVRLSCDGGTNTFSIRPAGSTALTLSTSAATFYTTLTASTNLAADWAYQLTNTNTSTGNALKVVGNSTGGYRIFGVYLGSTSQFAVFDTGAITMSGTLAVSGATLAFGATDPFSRGYSKLLTVNAAGLTNGAIEINSATGYSAYLDLGVNSTRITTIISDASGTDFGTLTATPLRLQTNNVYRLTIDSAGAATFSGTVQVGASDGSSGLTVTGAGRTRSYIVSTETSGRSWYWETAGAGNYGSAYGSLFLINATDSVTALSITRAGAATFSGTLAVTGTTVTVTGTSGYANLHLGNTTGGEQKIKFFPGSVFYAWMIAAQTNISNCLEFTPSTAVGGSTFSTPTFYLTPGAATVSGTLSIGSTGSGITFASSGGSGFRIYGSSGTHQWDMYLNSSNLRLSDNTGGGLFVVDTGVSFSSTLVVLDAVTISGKLNTSLNNNFIDASGSSTSARYLKIANTTGYTLFGVESSSGGYICSNAGAYASVFTTYGANPLVLGTNQIARLTIASGGGASFSGTLSASDTIVANKQQRSTALGDYTWLAFSGGSGYTGDYQQIAMGYTGTYYPLIFGSRTVSQAGYTTSAFFVATRTSTDQAVAPTERFSVNDTGAIRFNIYGAGTATFDSSGNITSVSDELHKTDIAPFTAGLTELRGLAPITHRYNAISGMETEHTYIGFSAQNVRQHIPGAVFEREDGILTLWDRGILAATVNAVQTLDQSTDQRLTALEQRLELLERPV